MNLDKICLTCLIEIKKKPVQLSEPLWKFLEDDLRFNDVPRKMMSRNICFSCYASVVAFRRFYLRCKEASQFFQKKLDSIQKVSSRPENTTQKYNYDEDSNEEEFTYITIEKANDIAVLEDDGYAGVLQPIHNEYCEDVKEPLTNPIICQEPDHPGVELENYDEKFMIEAEESENDNAANVDDCIIDDTTQEENVLIQAAFQSENYDIEPAVRPKVTRLFVCKICGKELNGKTELRVHETTHPGARPFPCEVCGVAFKQRSALNTHLPLHYGKTIPCPLCDKKFARKSFLTLHIRAHRGEKPFQCEQCGKTFRTGHLLAGHEQEHTGKLQFSCKFCSKSFYNRRSLIAHINHTHTHYYCNHCDKCFKKRPKVYEHLKNVHKIKEETENDYTKKIEKKMKT